MNGLSVVWHRAARESLQAWVSIGAVEARDEGKGDDLDGRILTYAAKGEETCKDGVSIVNILAGVKNRALDVMHERIYR